MSGKRRSALGGAIYGRFPVLFIIFMPKGILGALLEGREKRGAANRPAKSAPAA